MSPLDVTDSQLDIRANFVRIGGTVRAVNGNPYYNKTTRGDPILTVLIEHPHTNKPDGPKSNVSLKVWGKRADEAKELKPGDAVVVTGRLEVNNYKDGNNVWHTTAEITVHEMRISKPYFGADDSARPKA